MKKTTIPAARTAATRSRWALSFSVSRIGCQLRAGHRKCHDADDSEASRPPVATAAAAPAGARFELHVESAAGAPSASDWLLRGPGGRTETVFLDSSPLLDESAIASAAVEAGPDGSPQIRLVLTSEGAGKLAQITGRQPGRRLGVVLDGELRAAPLVRAEHREIRQLLDEIATSIGDAAAPVERLRSGFHAVLGDNTKEEQVLYPAADGLLGAENADRLVRRIQRYGP
jgi:hypothetical protein